MRVVETFSHLQALDIVRARNSVWDEITQVLEKPEIQFGHDSTSEIKSMIAESFNRIGWADRVRVHRSTRLTVSFAKDRVGLCVQLGNVARTYADILKLELLNDRGVIDVGVIVVPDHIASKSLGANYARFDRLTQELDLFVNIVAVPVLVVGISN